MSPEERQLLASLFDRIRTAAATPRDHEAEDFIDQGVREQPYTTYYLAQAVIVQEKGLEAAANHIKELEERIRLRIAVMTNLSARCDSSQAARGTRNPARRLLAAASFAARSAPPPAWQAACCLPIR
jgi:hypothetical protein